MSFIRQLFGSSSPQPDHSPRLHGKKFRVHAPNTAPLLAMSRDGRVVVTASAAAGVKLWHLDQLEPVRLAQLNISNIQAVAISDDARTVIAAGDYQGKPAIEVVGRGEIIVGMHDYPINRLALSPDGKLMASASLDWIIKVRDIDEPVIIVAKRLPDRLADLTFSADGGQMTAISVDWTLVRWDLTARAELLTWQGEADGHNAVLSRDGRWAALGNADRGNFLIDVETGISVAEWPHSGRLLALSSLGDDSVLAWEAAGNNARAWNPITQAAACELKHAQPVTGAAVSLDGRTVSTVSADGALGIWDPAVAS
jgi:WD40 repeat protein